MIWNSDDLTNYILNDNYIKEIESLFSSLYLGIFQLENNNINKVEDIQLLIEDYHTFICKKNNLTYKIEYFKNQIIIFYNNKRSILRPLYIKYNTKKLIEFIKIYIQSLDSIEKDFDFLENKIITDRNLSSTSVACISTCQISLKNIFHSKRLFTFKELSSLARKLGYKIDRYHGDHAIFKNLKTNKIVSIPNNTLGKGISRKIVKQLISSAEM